MQHEYSKVEVAWHGDGRRGVRWALAASVLSAVFIVPWKLSSAHASAPVMVVVMLGTAAAVGTAGLIWTRPVRRGDRRITWIAAACLAALTVVGNLASAAAVNLISGPLLAVVLRTEVIAVAVGAWLWLGERMDRGFVLGAAVAALGLWVLNQPGTASEATSSTGLGFAALASLCFGAMAVVTRGVIARVNAVMLNTVRLWISFALTCVVYWRTLSEAAFTPEVLAYGALAGLTGPGLARLFMMFSARFVPARVTALVMLTAPVWALLFCWAVMGTWPATREVVGSGIMLVGVGAAIALQHRHTRE